MNNGLAQLSFRHSEEAVLAAGWLVVSSIPDGAAQQPPRRTITVHHLNRLTQSKAAAEQLSRAVIGFRRIKRVQNMNNLVSAMFT